MDPDTEKEQKMEEQAEKRTEATACQEGAAIKQKKSSSPEMQENQGLGLHRSYLCTYYKKMNYDEEINK